MCAALGVALGGACAPAPLMPGETRNLFSNAPDGTPLVGTLYLPQVVPAPAVLLLHAAGNSRREWDPFAKRLRAAGFAALSLDFRGHGDSGGERAYPQLVGDLAVVWDALTRLPAVRPERTLLIGGSLGANVALAYAAMQPRVRAVALLSPGLGNYGYSAAPDAARYGARPLLILSEDADAYALASQRELERMAAGPLQSRTVHTARHGTALLHEPEAWDALLAWLLDVVR